MPLAHPGAAGNTTTDLGGALLDFVSLKPVVVSEKDALERNRPDRAGKCDLDEELRSRCCSAAATGLD